MSRLTQRTAVSPELLPLPLFHGGCDKLGWLPEGKVFSNVQRERIISRFLKESVLKRVFRAKQLRWGGPGYQKEDPSHSFPASRKPAEPEAGRAERLGRPGGSARGDAAGDEPGASGAERIPRKPRSKMGRKTGESSGPGPGAAVPGENLSPWNLDAEVPVPENKSLPPVRDGTTGGKINKNHLEIPADQLRLELTFSEFLPQRTQNSKQGLFQLWSYPLSEASTVELRDFKISSVGTGCDMTNNPIRLFGVNPPLTSASVDKLAGSCPALQVPLSLCCTYADGDFFKDRNEPHIHLCSTLENNSGELLTAPNWNLKYGNNSVEENLTDESDLSENEKANDTLLSYFKKMDLNLKPETIENVEEPFTEEMNKVFPYPDFLPPPFSTLDLHKLALSKSDSWKMMVEAPDSSLEPLMARLLDMERLQQLTIQRERPRLQTSFCAPVVTERPPSSKAVSKTRQPKPPDAVGLQMACVEKSYEKRKNSSGSYKPEHSAPKWNWNGAGKYKWSSRPALKASSTPKQVTAAHDDFKNPKISVLNPCQELTIKPAPVQTTQLLVKTVSARCLPPKSPTPISPIPLSFPDSHREETQAPRSKKKLYRKDVVLNRPFCVQKLNCCLSPSLIAKDKCSPTDQK